MDDDVQEAADAQADDERDGHDEQGIGEHPQEGLERRGRFSRARRDAQPRVGSAADDPPAAVR